jgi:F-type H+-transporting ATPase subunit delta
MKREKAAVIYARTLLETAESKGELPKVTADMQALAETFRQLPALHKYLGNPILGADAKAKLLGTAAGSLAPLTRQFLRLLETKNRLSILRAVADEYIALEESRRNVLRATVTSAVPLAKEQIDKLSKGLETNRPGKKIILTNIIDKSLIAGFRIQQGDVITDASIKNKLEQLKQKLAA